jgi:hypothetical protein
MLVILEGKKLKINDLLAFLPPLFRKGDVETCLGKRGYSAQVLNRALKKKLVSRITRGVYLNVLKCKFSGQWPSVEEVACYIKPAAYISLEWALHHHDIILQRPMVCTAVVAKIGSLRRIHFTESYGNQRVEYHIEYSVISNISRGFGIEKIGSSTARMSVPERAFLDWIHVRHPSEYLLSSWLEEMDLEALNIEKLKELSTHYPARVRKLAMLVEQ